MASFRYFPPVFLIAAAVLTGCGTVTALSPTVEAPPVKLPGLPTVEHVEADLVLYEVERSGGSLLTAEAAVRSRLAAAHADWDGTPYRYGGNTPAGTDCSGFVQRIFAEQFGLGLTRSTGTQVLEGREVRRDDLRPGDLVFFRTGRRQRHVGVYIGGGEFLHSSTRRGVTVDALASGYYDRTYWTARRVLSDEHIAALAPAEAPTLIVRRSERPAPVRATTQRPALHDGSARSDAGAPRIRHRPAPEPSAAPPATRRSGW